ncbi:hypothetical protein BH24DEI2_BH24DEI2_04200 [soil metagenome]
MIYLDSCIVIYLVERHPEYYSYLDRIFRDNAREVFATSSLVALECLVGPYKRDDEALEEKFEKFFAATSYFQIDDTIYHMAAGKRARYGIKTPDALHLSTAEFYDCTEFWTNDNRLEKVSPIVRNVLANLESLDDYGSIDFEGESRLGLLDHLEGFLSASGKNIEILRSISNRLNEANQLLEEETSKVRDQQSRAAGMLSAQKVARFMHDYADGIKGDARKLKESTATVSESFFSLIDATKKQPESEVAISSYRDVMTSLQVSVKTLKGTSEEYRETIRSSYGFQKDLTKAAMRVDSAFQQHSDAVDELIALTELALEKIDLP